MSYGLELRNDANHIVASSEISGLHYIHTINSPVSTSIKVNGFPNKYGNALYDGSGEPATEGSVLFKYDIYIPLTTPPIVFLRNPLRTLSCGVINQYWDVFDKCWKVHILRNSLATGSPPSLYIFSRLPDTYYRDPYDNYGIVMFNSSGKVTYDSTRGPLLINAQVTGIPPLIPPKAGKLGYADMGKDKDRATSKLTKDPKVEDNCNTYQTGLIDDGKDVIYYAPTVAQSVQERIQYASYHSDSIGASHSEFNQYWGYWQVMYYQTYRIPSADKVEFTWAEYATAYSTKHTTNGDGGFAGIGSTSGRTDVSGLLPYQNLTINYVPTTVLISDPSYYDVLPDYWYSIPKTGSSYDSWLFFGPF